ncbi:HAD-IIIA family hydrolase [Cellulomonas marina]|uniref:D,D-heptose 1,7-bisphosphate phosphatase n=1 Tax=Cellulomonas marina TaxID=988821 RepID=A0A1I0V6X7_9CELL|nr:HAD-IIIA family hydrolase [Cellulomonas marina]GIG28374.1 hypothetical protein Cma02nite_09740 [Cellulomonas marina]SFA72038.1 histidinol-phosphate phosphatase family domain-containing protein/HAD-superfamily hydrolase, subfamily IIIA [Cellulomonas marina]
MSAAPLPPWSLVLTSLGRPRLAGLLDVLTLDLAQATRAARASGRPLPAPVEVVVVDDRSVALDPRPDDDAPVLRDPAPLEVAGTNGPGATPVRVVRTGGRGPAAARNAGWRSASAPWVVLLDELREPAPGWAAALAEDLAAAATGAGGRTALSGGAAEAPTDAAAPGDDLLVRRDALAEVWGWDERIGDAEQAHDDLVARLGAAGWDAVPGTRRAAGPTAPEQPTGTGTRTDAPAPTRRTDADLTSWPPPVQAVLFDRDGTLVHDVPYNGDPDQVRVIAGAHEVLDALREAGVAVGIVSNQSGIARGLLSVADVAAVNARVAAEVGPFGTVQVCPHGTGDHCACRKPGPGLVLRAAHALGVPPYACAVVGDIGADVGAAVAAGARTVLVPTAVTRSREVATAPVVAVDLRAAVAHLVPGVLDPLPGGVPDGAPRTAGDAA